MKPKTQLYKKYKRALAKNLKHINYILFAFLRSIYPNHQMCQLITVKIEHLLSITFIKKTLKKSKYFFKYRINTCIFKCIKKSKFNKCFKLKKVFSKANKYFKNSVIV